MADQSALTPVPLPVDARMLAALHREACIECGRRGGPLRPAGHRFTIGTEGARLGWPVVSCPSHPEKADAS